MIQVTLPDKSQKQFSHPVTVKQVAENIGAGLARAALGGKVNDTLVDLSYLIEADATVSIITAKDPEGLVIIRHSTAHLLAQAVKQLFPTAQVTIGPVIEDGFFYDFAFGRPFTPEDLERIEAKMHEIAKKDLLVTRELMSRDKAVEFYRELGEEYKVQIIQAIPANELLSFYRQDDFIDLCRGPHVPNTGKLTAFKLTKLAGAYWRGDSNNEMLQRIYGTAWANNDDLKAYLERIAEAEKRDHRRLAKQLDLFHIQEEAPGMIFWHDKGWTLYRLVENYIRQKLQEHDYQEVRTPQIVDSSLWKKSGHWDKFRDDMFVTETENHVYAIKPMSCPCHVQIFNQGLKSYRDLPLRMAEFGSCHRSEPSGSLHGLLRVRNFVQDDGHIFCTEEQIQSEVGSFIKLLYEVYADFGFTDVVLRLATRPEKRVGSDEIWDKAEHALKEALNSHGLQWELSPGEGAFYGPKIEFSLRDSLGRVWQCGTMQVDFSMPERLGASYVDEDSTRQVPVMLHRAVLGTFERFLGIFIEHCSGYLPLWLAPQQVSILNITDRQADYCRQVADILKKQGFRASFDLRNEKIGFKIREHTLQRVPYLIIIGDREVETKQVAVRSCEGKDLGAMELDGFIKLLEQECSQRGSS